MRCLIIGVATSWGVPAICLVALAAVEHNWLGGISVALLIGLPSAMAARFAVRARVEARPQGLVVVRTLSSRRFWWEDIAAASSGWAGVTLTLRSGESFRAGAVQGSTMEDGRPRTKADEAADYINRRVRGA